jgi:stage III sporulation protein AG
MGNYLQSLKNVVKNKDKRVENIIFLIILLVVILVAINYIFATPSSKSSSNGQVVSNNTSNSNNINSSDNGVSSLKSDTEHKLEEILSQITGISDVSVMITYSQDSKQTPAYNTKETEKSGEKTTEKSAIYNEDGSKKTVLLETVEMPKIEGAIIVAKGATTVEVRSKIANAVASVTNVAAYKIQVFEKK